MQRFLFGLCLVVPGMYLSAAVAAPPKLPAAAPADVGLDAAQLAQIDEVVAEGLRKGQMPGCVVLIARHGKIAWLKPYGHRQLKPDRVPMTVDTVFDLASLTKPIATATSVMLLAEQGRLQLDRPAAEYLPAFGSHGKDRITILQLLTHQAGLIPDNSLRDYADGPDQAWQRVFALKPSNPAGEKFIYSDVGFLVLGELVRQSSGQDVHAFSRRAIFAPLGMTETGFLPEEPLRRRAAPTELRDGRWMQGEVHDPRAFALGGVAGHAGLFATAADLAVYAQMLLGGGQYAGVRVLAEATVQRMTQAHAVSSGFRGLGWDMHTAYSSNRGQAFSGRAFGHGGFTGTALWIDPELDLFVMFLSNRLHPDGKGSVNPLAGKIGTIAATAVCDRPSHRVRTGIDVLQRDGFRPLQGRRIGLITNHTGVTRDGVRTAKALKEAPGVQLVAIFSPEHGPEGKLDTAVIADSRDPELGLPLLSLYGKTRRPTPEMLRGIDTLVFDIQDIGTRFYTYISTMGYAMEEAARHGLRFVVLDRPNPIGGVVVDGPVLDAGWESFVGYHRLPIRHGMTVGELAQLFRDELRLPLDLQVVRCEGWRRGELFDATGLPWINPSPNMRSLSEALLYPGIGLLETTNLSVGRGTATPFELIGAPWLDGPRLAKSLAAANLPGIEFRAVTFTPDASIHRGEACQGVGFRITDRERFEPVHVGLEIARQLRAQYPQVWKADAYDRLLGNKQVHAALLEGRSVGEVETIIRPGLADFQKRRWRYLLYPP
jgi:uncharacterized protein YbbC (DUF1343 family)